MPRSASVRKSAAAKSAARKVKVKVTTSAARERPSRPVKVLNIGSICPDFKMPATKLGNVTRTSLKGKPFVLYFYPKDNTSGCTAEACDFRDNIAAFNKLGATVIGISRDSLSSHEKFAKKFELQFPLASDEEGRVCELFGVWVKKSMYGRSYMGIERSTFVIDSKGVIRAIWRKVSVPQHIGEVKKALGEL